MSFKQIQKPAKITKETKKEKENFSYKNSFKNQNYNQNYYINSDVMNFNFSDIFLIQPKLKVSQPEDLLEREKQKTLPERIQIKPIF